MIEAKGLRKDYAAILAVSGLNFRIEPGEVVGLLGPNGAGKSTTMRMLTTFLPPTSGTASINGHEITTDPEGVRRSIGYLPESPPLYQELTVTQYLRFVGKLKGLSRENLGPKVNDVIESCGLTGVRNRLCGTLSKGYKQRVGIAQAIVHSPPVIILDEPTSGLDPAQIIEIRRLIVELGGKHTVILSTHILQEVTQTCSRVIMIARGRIVMDGVLAELTKQQTLEERFLQAINSESIPEVVEPKLP